jgi:MSHA pilin protein MshA
VAFVDVACCGTTQSRARKQKTGLRPQHIGEINMNKQQGFTLIELIVVIVILGILAATALPRFISVQTEARIASVNGLAGGLRSAVSLVEAKYMMNGNNAATTVNMSDGTVVTVSAGSGVPAATAPGIGNAMQTGNAGTIDGYTINYGANPATFWPTNGGSANCGLTYNGTTGIVIVTAGSGVGGC